MTNMPRHPILEAPGQASADSLDRFRRRTLYMYAGAALVVAVVVALAFRFIGSAPATPSAAQTPTALTVTTAKPHRTTWAATVSASGSITAWQEASIGAQVGGYQLVDVLVNVGDEVKKGQVLAKFDSALLQAEEAQLSAAAEQAEANRQRAVTLKSSGNMSEQTHLQAITLAKTAAAQLAAKRLQLRYTSVTAPDDGVISARAATLGAVVPTGQELFRLIRQNRLEWRGELTAEQMSHIAIGQRITLTLPDGSTAIATVRQLAPSLDSQTRLGTVYADIERGSTSRAGMYVAGRIAMAESAVLAVPAESVVIRDGRNFVFKLDEAGAISKLSQQVVTVGRREGKEVEIVSGLKETDAVVVQGAGFLNDGDVVRVAEPKP